MFNKSDLHSYITFDAATGKIHLKDQRMILVGTDAIGLLRRDLIRSVGMDQAKKILLRYGRNYGVEFARNLKALFFRLNHRLNGSMQARKCLKLRALFFLKMLRLYTITLPGNILPRGTGITLTRPNSI